MGPNEISTQELVKMIFDFVKDYILPYIFLIYIISINKKLIKIEKEKKDH